MQESTRESVIDPNYDELYRDTDRSTNRVRFASHIHVEGEEFTNYREAHRHLSRALDRVWRSIRRSISYAGASCFSSKPFNRLEEVSDRGG